MRANTHEQLKTVVVEFLKDTPETATMTFSDFYGAINTISPCERAELSVTVTLMNLLGEVQITKDELGRGRGFSLTGENLEVS